MRLLLKNDWNSESTVHIACFCWDNQNHYSRNCAMIAFGRVRVQIPKPIVLAKDFSGSQTVYFHIFDYLLFHPWLSESQVANKTGNDKQQQITTTGSGFKENHELPK